MKDKITAEDRARLAMMRRNIKQYKLNNPDEPVDDWDTPFLLRIIDILLDRTCN